MKAFAFIGLPPLALAQSPPKHRLHRHFRLERGLPLAIEIPATVLSNYAAGMSALIKINFPRNGAISARSMTVINLIEINIRDISPVKFFAIRGDFHE